MLHCIKKLMILCPVYARLREISFGEYASIFQKGFLYLPNIFVGCGSLRGNRVPRLAILTSSEKGFMGQQIVGKLRRQLHMIYTLPTV